MVAHALLPVSYSGIFPTARATAPLPPPAVGERRKSTETKKEM